MPFVGKPRPTPPDNAAEQRQIENETQHIAEVYVNRRKVAEHRASTAQKAHELAEQDKSKYAGQRVSIILREAPRVR